MKKEIEIKKEFLSKLHQLIYDNSNTQIGLSIDKECKKFIKILEKLDFEDNNN